MNGGVLAVFVVMAVPVVWVLVVLVSDAWHNRRVRAQPERTVDGIRERLEREQAEADFASAPTEVLPRIQPAPADESTVELPPILPKRTRPYVQRPRPHPRRSLAAAFRPRRPRLGRTAQPRPGVISHHHVGLDLTDRTGHAELVAAYTDGQTLEGLSAAYGLSYRQVRERLLDAGVTLRPAKIPLRPTPPGLVTAYCSGLSLRATAAQFGLSYNATRDMLLRAGVGLRSPGAPPASQAADMDREKRNRRILRDYASGQSISAISRTYELSPHWTGTLLRQLGADVPKTGRGIRIDLDTDEVAREYESGLTVRQVAALYGVSYGKIYRLLVEAGVTFRPRGG